MKSYVHADTGSRVEVYGPLSADLAETLCLQLATSGRYVGVSIKADA